MGTMGRFKGFVISLVLLLTLQVAAAARTQQGQHHSVIRTEDAGSDINRLNTYYFDATKPHIELSSRGSSRPERTSLLVKLWQPSVTTFMPVVTPQPSGMTHSVSNTWQALKNLATMFTKVNSINHGQQSPSKARLFPRAAVAVKAASDNTPDTPLDVATIITVAETTGQRSSWAEVTPSSVLLLPYGQSTAAVADLWDVTYDTKADAVTLELDVVHQPHTVSEFEPHGKQTLEVDEAHYHFNTAPSVKVDAAALLDSLQSSSFALEGVHLFLKGFQTDPVFECWPCTLTAAATQVDVGQEVAVTVTLASAADLDCVCEVTSDKGDGEGVCCSADGNPPGLCNGPCGLSSDLVCCAADPCCKDGDRCCEGETLCEILGDLGFRFCCSGTDCCRNTIAAPPSDVQAGGAATSQPGTLPALEQLGPKTGPKPHSGPTKHNKQSSHQPGLAGSSKLPLQQRTDIPVTLTLVGHAVWVTEGDKSPSIIDGRGHAKLPRKRKQVAADSGVNMLSVVVDASGGPPKAVASLRVTGPGPITILRTDVGTGGLSCSIVINDQCSSSGPPPVSKLKLTPSRAAYRLVHDPITVTALASDANGLAVAGAKVAFSVFGDCKPTSDGAVKTTDASGLAKIQLSSNKPGAVSIVAAGVGANGTVVLSDAAHVFYFERRKYVDDREREYFLEEDLGPHRREMSDAYKYSKAAAQGAEQLVKTLDQPQQKA